MKPPLRRVVFFGYHDIGCRVLQALHDAGAEIVGVVTHADDAKENVWFRSVRELAGRLSLPVLQPESPNTEDVIAQVSEWRPDYMISAYYRTILGCELLKKPSCAALNLHGSLLPRYRGRAPVNWVLVNGETETGLTLHHMTAEPDAGDIVAQERVKIVETDTALSLYSKMTTASGALIERIWLELENGTAVRTPQDPTQATYFGRRTPEDGLINWHLAARQVYNLVRAVTHPYPGAFTPFRGKPLYVWWGTVGAQPSPQHGKLSSGAAAAKSSSRHGASAREVRSGAVSPGTVLDVNAGGLTVQTTDGAFVIERVAYDGVESPAPEFAQKHDVRCGERLGIES